MMDKKKNYCEMADGGSTVSEPANYAEDGGSSDSQSLDNKKPLNVAHNEEDMEGSGTASGEELLTEDEETANFLDHVLNDDAEQKQNTKASATNLSSRSGNAQLQSGNAQLTIDKTDVMVTSFTGHIPSQSLDESSLSNCETDWLKNVHKGHVRTVVTPDEEIRNIYPDLFCLTNLSPTEFFGQETIGYKQAQDRHETGMSGSTLNTPDPVLFEDTDSNSSVGLQTFMAHCSPSPHTLDFGNQINESGRGMKRKMEVIDSANGNASALMPQVQSPPLVNIMNHGRPPDISTWTAVNTNQSYQQNFAELDDNSQWSKPMCKVLPCYKFYQSLQQKHSSSLQLNGIDLTDNAVCANKLLDGHSISSSFYSQNLPFQGPSCQHTPKSSRVYANNDQNFGYGSVRHTSASYRLDFESPVSVTEPSPMPSFISSQSYLPANLARPRALVVNNIRSMNSSCSSGNLAMINGHGLSFKNYNFLPVNTTPQMIFAHSSRVNNSSSSLRNSMSSDQFSYLPYGLPLSSAGTTRSESICGVYNNDIQPIVTQAFNAVNSLSSNRRIECSDNNRSEISDVECHIFKKSRAEVDIDRCRQRGHGFGFDSAIGNNAKHHDENQVSNAITHGIEQKNCNESDNNTHFEAKQTGDIKQEIVHKCRTIETTNNIHTYLNDSDKIPELCVLKNEPDSTVEDVVPVKTYEQFDCVDVNNNSKTPVELEHLPNSSNTNLFSKSIGSNENFLMVNHNDSFVKASCSALDLTCKSDVSKTSSMLPIGQPFIPVTAVLNTMKGPTLSYSGGMLVPYMNSIFAAMASYKSQSLPSDSTAANTSYMSCSVPSEQSVNNMNSLSTHGNGACQTSSAYGCTGSGYNPSNLVHTVSSYQLDQAAHSVLGVSVRGQMLIEPRINLNSTLLPLYATPLQYPVRPLVPFVSPALSTTFPLLCRFNFGMPSTSCSNAGGVSTNLSADADVNNTTTTTDCNKISNAAIHVSNNNTNCGSNAAHNCDITDQSTNSPSKFTLPQTQTKISNKLPSICDRQNSELVNNCLSSLNKQSMWIQGGHFTAPTQVKTGGLTAFFPIPDMRTYREQEDKKCFKAKHYNFTELHIGNYKYVCDTLYTKTAKVKFLFSKKWMVYEYQLTSPATNSTQGACKHMAEIEVPFNTIVALWIFDSEMRLEVDTVPKMVLGKKGAAKDDTQKHSKMTLYNRQSVVDITGGQLSSSPYHYFRFKTPCADRIKMDLCRFDNRFLRMLKLPLIEDPCKSLKPGARHIVSHLLDPSIQLPDEHNKNTGPVYNPAVVQGPLMTACACNNGCTSDQCKCCIQGSTCFEGLCLCVNCRNPLNILHQLGLPTVRAKTDPCLMDNIFQIQRLDCYVNTQLMLECCQTPVLLFNCIPGVMNCPNVNCPARYRYSWCSARLCNETISPRNHCDKCRRCTDFRNMHCQRCNICYFAGENHTFKCPVCLDAAALNQAEGESSADSDV